MSRTTRLRKADLVKPRPKASQDWLQRLCNHPVLSHEETMGLVTLFQNGDYVARERLIRCNMRLVVSIAKRYFASGIPLEDLISEGTIGLMHGINNFDVSLGNKLSTYVTWWIRQGISRAIAEKRRIVRIPVHFEELLSKIRRAEQKIYALTGREYPEAAEILEYLGMEVTKTNINNVNRLRGGASKVAFSLNKEVDSKGGATHQDNLTDSNLGPEAALAREEGVDILCGSLGTLTERHREVVIKRVFDERTLEDISQDPGFGVTRERIRQIEAKALQTLRSHLENQPE